MNSTVDTKCVQAGYTPKQGEPRQVPIYQSTTFKYDTSEQMGKLFDLEASGYFYTRLQNPTNDLVAEKIAALEGGVAAMLTSSGQAANFYAVFNICECGDHFISSFLSTAAPTICSVFLRNHFPRRVSPCRRAFSSSVRARQSPFSHPLSHKRQNTNLAYSI